MDIDLKIEKWHENKYIESGVLDKIIKKLNQL